MRRLEEILRTYNIVNSRSGSRYTVRFTAAFALLGVGVVATAMMLSGGPGPAPEMATSEGDRWDDGDPARAPPGLDVPQIGVTERPDGHYIGYPLEGYHRSMREHYDESAVKLALIEWLTVSPGEPHVPLVAPPQEVYDPNGEGILLGYIIKTR